MMEEPRAIRPLPLDLQISRLDRLAWVFEHHATWGWQHESPDYSEALEW
jgi:hypothetical protein